MAQLASGNGVTAREPGDGYVYLDQQPMVFYSNSTTVNIPQAPDNRQSVVDTAGAVIDKALRPVNLAPVASGGYDVYCHVNDSAGMLVQAPVNVVIEVAGTKSTAGGYVYSTTIGAVLHLVSVNSLLWVNKAWGGNWYVHTNAGDVLVGGVADGSVTNASIAAGAAIQASKIESNPTFNGEVTAAAFVGTELNSLPNMGGIAISSLPNSPASGAQAGVPLQLFASAATDGYDTHRATAGGNVILHSGAGVNGGDPGVVNCKVSGGADGSAVLLASMDALNIVSGTIDAARLGTGTAMVLRQSDVNNVLTTGMRLLNADDVEDIATTGMRLLRVGDVSTSGGGLQSTDVEAVATTGYRLIAATDAESVATTGLRLIAATDIEGVETTGARLLSATYDVDDVATTGMRLLTRNDVGSTGAGLIALDGGSPPKLPAVDGSLLTAVMKYLAQGVRLTSGTVTVNPPGGVMGNEVVGACLRSYGGTIGGILQVSSSATAGSITVTSLTSAGVVDTFDSTSTVDIWMFR